jgi:hypothetical protein
MKLNLMAPIFLFALLVVMPIVCFPYDMWDGAILQYASEIRNYSGIQIYFFESTWFFQYPLTYVASEFGHALNLPYTKVTGFLTLLFGGFLLREAWFFVIDQMKFQRATALVVISLIASSPVWGDLLSSVMLFHFGCIGLGLFAVRQARRKSLLIKFFGFVALVVSFSLNSQLMFLAALSYVYDCLDENRTRKFRVTLPSKDTASVLVVGFIVYGIVRIWFPPHGLYEGYNQIVITSFRSIGTAFLNLCRFCTYLIPLLVASVVYFLLMRVTRSGALTCGLPRCKRFGLFILLFFSGVLPYVAVGKSSLLWAIEDWSSRQAILTVFPTAILCGLVIELVFDSSRLIMGRKIAYGIACMFITVNVVLLSIGVVQKLNRQLFSQKIVEILKGNQDRIPPGLLQIVGDGIPDPRFRWYEANYLLFKAMGRADWWVRIDSQLDPTWTVPIHIAEREVYRVKYVLSTKVNPLDSHAILRINAKNFTGLKNAIVNVLRNPEHASISLLVIESI